MILSATNVSVHLGGRVVLRGLWRRNLEALKDMTYQPQPRTERAGSLYH